MSLYLGENKIADNTCSRNIGEIVASTIPINEAGLHLLDGALISSTGSYAKFVNHIAGLYNQTGPSSVTYCAWSAGSFGTLYTTSSTPSVGDATYAYNNGVMSDNNQPITNIGSDWIGIWTSSPASVAIEYDRTSSSDVTLTVQTPPPYFCSESDWQSSVSTYGVCGKFVYDSVNNTVRLPKITGFTEGTIDVTALGDLIEAGLPNITGRIGNFDVWGFGGAAIRNVEGAFGSYGRQNNLQKSVNTQSITGGNDYRTADFNASRSSSIYGNSTTVQPQAIKVLYYIVIASSITNELNLDVADMADKDFSNIASTGTSLASGWSMPSSRYDDLTPGASGSIYQMPANGYLCVGATHPDNTSWESIGVDVLDSNGVFLFNVGGTYNLNNQTWWFLVPVSKDFKVQVWSNGFSITRLRFIYAEGENV